MNDCTEGRGVLRICRLRNTSPIPPPPLHHHHHHRRVLLLVVMAASVAALAPGLPLVSCLVIPRSDSSSSFLFYILPPFSVLDCDGNVSYLQSEAEPRYMMRRSSSERRRYGSDNESSVHSVRESSVHRPAAGHSKHSYRQPNGGGGLRRSMSQLELSQPRTPVYYVRRSRHAHHHQHLHSVGSCLLKL